ncbi:MAG: hypothetical protein IPK04_03555 [Bdellovibrionales bacterium]|jgi:hypothetical protein|nr:hypothetical protein [Bdellovibrionales bacterium]
MKVLNLFFGLQLTLVILLFGISVNGQEKKTKANPKGVTFKENKASLNFDDELVEATTQKPDLFYLFQRKNFNYNRLIKLRENFIPEMRKTTEDVQRVRGGN